MHVHVHHNIFKKIYHAVDIKTKNAKIVDSYRNSLVNLEKCLNLNYELC